jgi:hypothetical protein
VARSLGQCIVRNVECRSKCGLFESMNMKSIVNLYGREVRRDPAVFRVRPTSYTAVLGALSPWNKVAKA